MNPQEAKLYGDIVELHNRTKEELDFKFDSRNYEVSPKKPLKIPRHIALHAVNKHPVTVDSESGIVTESLFGIDDDPKYPITKIGDIDMQALREEDKLDGAVVSDGKEGEMEVIEVAPKKKPGRPKKEG